MGINSPNEVVRLKNGNILIKLDYQLLKIYWNITKEVIEKVVRIDYPCEVPPYLKGQYLHTFPNINFQKKFYLKKFSTGSRTQQFVFHKFFKKYTRCFVKKFDQLKYIEGTNKLFFEGCRIFDTQIYERESVFKRETESYGRLYNLL